MRGGARPGSGRPKGVPNKDNQLIRDMVVGALHDVGGRAYLARQAEANPSTFLMLVGKVLPLQLTGDPEKPIAIDFSWAPTQPAATTVVEAVAERVAERVIEVSFDDIGDC